MGAPSAALAMFKAGKAAEREQAFQDWFANVAEKRNWAPNPDDPEHYYNYRRYYGDVLKGKEDDLSAGTDDPDSHFPSTYKLEGHPRTYLQDSTGRPFDTRSAAYLNGKPVSQRELTLSEDAPDMPGYKPPPLTVIQALLAAKGMRR